MNTTQNNSNNINFGTFISLLALVVSISAFLHTVRNTTSENDRTIRFELTNTLDKINNLAIENTKIHKNNPNDLAYSNEISSILNQQNISLLGHAELLAEQIPDLVSSFDLNTIAVGNQSAGFYLKADEFHRKAVKKAKDIEDHLLQLSLSRSYAQFLMYTGKTSDGREQFKYTISLAEKLPTRGQDDIVPYRLGYIYMTWGYSEAANNNKEQSKIYFDKAEQEFSKIANPFVKDHNLKLLDNWISTAEQNPGKVPLTPNKPDCDLVLYGDCI